MPEIARFFGIVITMYPEAGERHNRPHFHARYSSQRAIFAIDSGDILAGSLTRTQLRLVQAWVELHQGELEANWRKLLAGQAPDKIEPLK
jgi:hypothetical protein